MPNVVTSDERQILRSRFLISESVKDPSVMEFLDIVSDSPINDSKRNLLTMSFAKDLV